MFKTLIASFIKSKVADKVVKNRKSLLDISLRDIGRAGKKTVKKGLMKIINKI